MACHEVKVVHCDSSSLMHLTHGCSGVGQRPAEGGGEEFHLPALQTRHVGAGEERCVINDSFDELGAVSTG
ncbi:hypothetical protein MAGR_44770 [Mycolicibacterium agri]|uniref:Uncharacterized protein n=1 Tax=Mycolicibacterium agri TaxID=36811 RepID=A0A7I9W798_MYCAG|nr:hypothetical protein MAGR_44770 [Mycolicibacterium agri]